MTRTINALLLGATLVLAACEAQPKTEPKDTPKPAANPIEEPPPSEPAVLSGVGPSGAEGRDARRQAALDLLTDGQTAAALPIDATDPDQKFDPRLAEKMAPKVRLSDVPSSSSGSSSHRTGQVKYKPTMVEGPLDRDVIYRMVRAHINEVRHCYNTGLSEDPKLAGRVTINFVILGTGKVGSSVVHETTLGDTTVGNCIAKAVKRWTFTKPRGGENVIVDFAFDLSPK